MRGQVRKKRAISAILLAWHNHRVESQNTGTRLLSKLASTPKQGRKVLIWNRRMKIGLCQTRGTKSVIKRRKKKGKSMKALLQLTSWSIMLPKHPIHQSLHKRTHPYSS